MILKNNEFFAPDIPGPAPDENSKQGKFKIVHYLSRDFVAWARKQHARTGKTAGTNEIVHFPLEIKFDSTTTVVL